MLHFFRKIRRDLLANSQFFKYLKYAVGEIILVVLGILIALYINDWNEERNNQEQFDNILSEIEQELVFNIKNIKVGLEGFHRYDSAHSIVLFDGLRQENFKNDTLFLFRTLPTYFLGIQTEAFQKLRETGHGRTPQQDSIYELLTSLYNADTVDFIQDIEQTSWEIRRKIEESREEYSWFTNTFLAQPYTEEEINYYIDNPQYKKDIAKSAFYTLNTYNGLLIAWDYRLVKGYHRIYNYLENNNLKHSDSLYFVYNPGSFKHYIGRYRLKECTGFLTENVLNIASETYVEIELVDSYFKIIVKNNSDGEMRFLWGEIIPVNKYHFRTKGGATGQLIFDENDNVSELFYGNGTFKFKFEKIR